MSVTNSMSPEDLAQSLRQNAWTFLANEKDAPNEAVRRCCRYLQNFGYEATHMSLKSGKDGDAPSGHGQYNYNRPDQKLYCKRCSTHNKPTFRDITDIEEKIINEKKKPCEVLESEFQPSGPLTRRTIQKGINAGEEIINQAWGE